MHNSPGQLHHGWPQAVALGLGVHDKEASSSQSPEEPMSGGDRQSGLFAQLSQAALSTLR